MSRLEASSVVLAFFLASAVSGQVALPTVNAAKRADGKGYDVTIANTGKSAITALYILGRARLPSGNEHLSLVAKDYAFTANEQPIAPGDTRLVRAAFEPELKAVLFSDGAAAGDPAWIAAAKQGRQLKLQAIEEVIQLVDAVRAQQRSPEEAIQELNRMAAAVAQRPRPLMPEEAALRAAGGKSAEVVYRGAATDIAADRPGSRPMSIDERLLALKTGFLSTRQRALGMALELTSPPKGGTQ
jgi:hypothetical protein